MNFKIDTLRKSIGLGFALMIGLLAVSIGATEIQVQNISDTTDKLAYQYHPASLESVKILNGVNHSIAAVRALVLLKKDSYKQDLDDIWETEIRSSFNKLTELSKERENPENSQLISQLRPLLNSLHSQQQEIANLAQTDLETATEILESNSWDSSEIRNLLKKLTTNQEVLTTQILEKGQQQISLLANSQWILLFFSVIVGIALAMKTSRSIADPIDKAVSLSNNIAEGDLDTEVKVRGSKEIETLGNALEGMRRSLKQKTEDTNTYDWLTSGQNKLNNVTRGDQEIEELANNIISFITQYVDASIGALYLMNDRKERMNLIGEYAFTNGKNQDSFSVGEGLIGQAAVDQKTILLKNIEETHITITSSLVEATPRNIIATPFMVDGETLGVIEIGKFDDFDEQDINFVESNMENIGIALNSAITRKTINDLLEETQQQSGELQQQQEELEQINEELEEQSQNLKEQQEELQASNEELEEQAQMLEQKNRDLERARAEIERKAKQLETSSKYKSEFLANMSHELRTPLNSLLILSKDLIKNKNNNLNEDEIESAEIIAKSGRDLLILINEILDLSKIEAGKMELNLREINLSDLADDLSRKFKKQAVQKNIQLKTHIDEALPENIKTDRQRLEQILKNLLSNALKFTDEGEVKMSFIRNAGDFLSIAVSDTGIGIPEDKQDEIFKAFKQGEGGTARKYGGTGLGLSISKELAELLDGKIELESIHGEGSTFTVSIPIRSEKLAAKKQISVQQKKNGSKTITPKVDSHYIDHPSIDDHRDDITSSDHTILIIEDDHDFARILAKQAEEKGFHYLAASSGEDGLLLAEEFLPVAVILDLELPGIDGHMVLKELKGNPKLRHIPVHIISAEEKTLDPIKSGAVQYFTKPVTKEQLNDAFGRIEDFINRDMKTLLIVEDNESLRKSIIRLIGNGDVKCIEASTAEEAIKIINNNPVDCIVLDIGLPDMNGFDFIMRLEQGNKKEIPPIIVYTGKELTKKETEKLQEYAETVIVKGIKSEERLLDETALFLHRTIKNLPEEKQQIITDLYDKETIFRDKKILLVDDDMRNVFALSKVLKEKGMEVIKADNGLVALQKLEDQPEIDLVLMDIMMPEMDGYACMQKIRNQKKFKELPLIALTAKAMKNDRQKCLDAGANDYITKPVDLERLLSLMRIWINK